MDNVKFICTKDDFKGEADVRVRIFDAFENYDMLNEFFGKHDKKLMEDKATYFEGYDFQAWDDYVIMENGEIISRAGIWKMNDSEWEVAGVLRLIMARIAIEFDVYICYNFVKQLYNNMLIGIKEF